MGLVFVYVRFWGNELKKLVQIVDDVFETSSEPESGYEYMRGFSVRP